MLHNVGLTEDLQMWLLDPKTKAIIENAEAAGFIPTAEQQTQFLAARRGEDILTVAGDQAEISVKGVLTKNPSFMALFFGGGNATYTDIATAITDADNDPAVSRITLDIDSPGGNFDGLFNVIGAMQAATTPITARIDGLACSAAYAIASQADRIVAVDKGSRVGSIGVVATVATSDRYVEITSTDAPKKRPNVKTEEGVAMVVEELDALHDLFVEAIATGRKTTVKRVNKEFGQGATLLAEKALSLGMIDAIGDGLDQNRVNNPSPTASRGANLEAPTMDLETLKAQHPATYAAAVKAGIDSERDRVTAHVIMAETSKDYTTALTAIKEGSHMTATLQATYMAAGMAARDIDNRTQDEQTAAAAASNTNITDPVDADASASAVADIVLAQMGVA